MLVSLAIANVVLIDRLSLTLDSGLCALTGETGAGKSILLDSLGLALGHRGNAALVRAVANEKEDPATVTAAFDVADQKALDRIFTDAGLNPPEPGEALVLRRSLDKSGRSRAWINDQPASIGLLREIGEKMVEIEGQFATQGLMDAATHRTALDSFAGLTEEAAKVATVWHDWREAEDALFSAEEALARAKSEEEFLRYAVDELAALDPKAGEEDELAATRTMLMNGEKLIEGLVSARQALSDGDTAEDRIGTALRVIQSQMDKAGGRLDELAETLGQAADRLAEADQMLQRIIADSEPDPARLEQTEERLFALRAAARKHGKTVDELPAFRAEMETQLAGVEDADASLKALRHVRDKAKEDYKRKAEKLSKKRQSTAGKLDKAVAGELPPLKLEKAQFFTRVDPMDESDWGPGGIDHIRFEVATNPGADPGPIGRIASGGELARFLLALKVVMHKAGAVPTLVFDEVDSGIGGATASAVGKRLAQLATDTQVLVVTHSPQVAAFASRHLRVSKADKDGMTITTVEHLSDEERREEIARMLAGSTVTAEARAAADALIKGHDA